jgi:hypothetical protein
MQVERVMAGGLIACLVVTKDGLRRKLFHADELQFVDVPPCGSRTEQGLAPPIDRSFLVLSELDKAYDAWKAADAELQEAISRVEAEWLRYARGGPPPSLGTVEAEANAHQRANEMLTAAIEIVKRVTGLEP